VTSECYEDGAHTYQDRLLITRSRTTTYPKSVPLDPQPLRPLKLAIEDELVGDDRDFIPILSTLKSKRMNMKAAVGGLATEFTELVDEGDLFFGGDDGVTEEDDAALGAAEWKYLSV
jgi:hypothetical protein